MYTYSLSLLHYITLILLKLFFQVQYILSDGSILVQQKEIKKDSNKNNYRRMIVVNQQDLTPTQTVATTTTHHQVPVTQQRIITQQIPSNGNIETKSAITIQQQPQQSQIQSQQQQQQQQRVSQQAMTPLGPLTLTAEEYNELMQRRIQKQQAEADAQQRKAQQEANERAQQEAQQRAVQQQQQIHHQHLQEHQNINMQVQKIVQSLEDDAVDEGDTEGGKKDDDIEMQMIVPKLEAETVKTEEGTTSNKQTTKNAEKNAGRPFTCEQCGKKFLLKHHLTTHARVHSGNECVDFLGKQLI